MIKQPMVLKETDIGDSAGRFAELGLIRPTGFCILPSNFHVAEKQSNLFLPQSAPDLKIILRQAGLTPDKIAPEGVRIPYRDDRDSSLILPVLFFAACYISENPNALNVALGVVANYVTEYFAGKRGTNRVTFGIHVETTTKQTAKTTETITVKSVSYEGDPAQFDKFVKTVKELATRTKNDGER